MGGDNIKSSHLKKNSFELDDLFIDEEKIRYRKQVDQKVVGETIKIFDNFRKEGLQDRTGQYEMALEIAEAIRDQHHVMIEAGVGIGKSLGYLIPSLLARNFLYGPIIVATSSIALSEQLMQDVKQASQLINKNLNRHDEIKTVLAKGANNYVCLQKVHDNLEKRATLIKKGSKIELNPVLSIPQWVWDESLHNHERNDYSQSVPKQYWKFLNGNHCDRKSCNYKADCSYAKMRFDVGNDGLAEVIIVNQDMFLISLLKERSGNQGMLHSNPSLIIIDEAHNLETKTRKALTSEWTQESMLKVLNDIDTILVHRGIDGSYFKYIDNAKKNVEVLFETIENRIAQDIKHGKYKEESIRFFLPNFGKESMYNWDRRLNSVYTVLAGGFSQTSRSKMNNNDPIDKLGQLANAIKGLAEMHNPLSNNLLWVEKNDDNETILCTAPKQINKELNYMLFREHIPPICLTSATLCHPDSSNRNPYEYQIKSIGFIGETYDPKPSPFPYDTNSLLYLPSNITDPANDHENYILNISDRIIKLCKLTNGRTLILFTAKEDLKQVYDILMQHQLPWKILKQLDGGAQAAVTQRFIESKGVLLATGLWEGFNIKGPDLSSVIITKLPFPVPDPIITYKQSQVSDRWSILVPEMLIKLRQGAGRLIRDTQDTGVLSILDSRASEKSGKHYAKDIREALPIKKMTDSLEFVAKFCRHKISNIA